METVLPQRSEFSFWTPLEVRWADMDAMGHVNNAAYFLYFESARVHFYDTLDIGAWYGGLGQGFALVHAAANFRQEVRYPAALDIGTRVVKLTARSMRFQQALFFRDEETLAADGTSVLVWLDQKQHKAVEFPDLIRERLVPFCGNSGG